MLLRDPGSAGVTILGATVLDVTPPAITRRGAAAAAGRELRTWPDVPSTADLLRRHGLLRADALTAMGIPPGAPPGSPAPVTAGDWLADPDRWAALRRQLAGIVTAHVKRDPLAIGMALEAARAALGLPDRALVEALAGGQVQVKDGYLRPPGPRRQTSRALAAAAGRGGGPPGPGRPGGRSLPGARGGAAAGSGA